MITDKFTRVRWLFGDDFEKLTKSTILVCGCGGVGGFCIDALYRTGITKITAIDCDCFEVTNQNRQLGSEFIGERKSDIFASLYPGIETINLQLTKYILDEFDFSKFDLVIDCIDDIPAKIAMAKRCSTKLISSMGGAKRIDPRKIIVDSIWNTKEDPFARKIRYELRKDGFKGDFTTVFSTEPPKCTGLGSFMGVTATFGLYLSSLAIQKILHA